MALLVTKQGKKLKETETVDTAPAKTHDDATEIVDKLAILDETIKELKKQLKPFEDKKKELTTKFQDDIDSEYLPDDKDTIKGDNYYCEFGAKSKSTNITDVKKLHELLGDDVFYEIAKVGIGDIKKYLSLQEQAAVIEEVQEGKRSLKFTPMVTDE